MEGGGCQVSACPERSGSGVEGVSACPDLPKVVDSILLNGEGLGFGL